uniref:C2H2-type domain-containing protein n=1 Tax=Trichogramma kaykai TaxID=54128 RepID=A0ABD2WUY0_9HYME
MPCLITEARSLALNPNRTYYPGQMSLLNTKNGIPAGIRPENYQPYTRPRNFKCITCEASFSIQKELNYHIRHNCGRCHQCGVCFTTYRSLQTAKVHFKKRHPDVQEMRIFSLPASLNLELNKMNIARGVKLDSC